MGGGMEIEDDERQELGRVSQVAKGWLTASDSEYRRVWRRIVRAASRPRADLDVEVDYEAPTRVAMAIEKIAYAHVHLQHLARRLAAPDPSGPESAPATTTTSVGVTSFSTSAPPAPWTATRQLPLSVHRAYVEWALVLARKLSQALARTADQADDPSDILACHLVDDPGYSLPGLNSELIRRINKRPIHLAYFDDPDEGLWRVAEMARDLGGAVERLIDDISHNHPDRADELRLRIREFERQLIDGG